MLRHEIGVLAAGRGRPQETETPIKPTADRHARQTGEIYFVAVATTASPKISPHSGDGVERLPKLAIKIVEIAELAGRRVEVITGGGGRRRWSNDEKARAIGASLAPGVVISGTRQI
jgi:hypothetical protein